MIKRSFAIIACVFMLLSGGKAMAQSVATDDLPRFHAMEDSMLVTIDSMYDAFIPDTRTEYCERFVKQLVRTLKMPNSYYFTFDKLKDKINILYPDDNAFRIFNWSVAPTEVTQRYYGAIQLPQEQLKLYGLSDYSSELGKGLEDSILSNNRWFGAIYYRAIMHEVNGRKIYTMFGFNGGGPISNKKVLDPMTFTDNGVVFGAQIFGVPSENIPQQRVNRFILEYKKGVNVSMNWDDQLNVIFFDRLSSQVNDPNRKYTYVPSGEYDGLRWTNDQWTMVHDLIPVQILKDGEAPSNDVVK